MHKLYITLVSVIIIMVFFANNNMPETTLLIQNVNDDVLSKAPVLSVNKTPDINTVVAENDLKVYGVVKFNDNKGLAMISLHDEPEKVFQVGDEIVLGIFLEQIYKNKVSLKREKEVSYLEFTEKRIDEVLENRQEVYVNEKGQSRTFAVTPEDLEITEIEEEAYIDLINDPLKLEAGQSRTFFKIPIEEPLNLPAEES
ncbi:MAG: type II secretion system protein N [Woeseiaceae bacterium]